MRLSDIMGNAGLSMYAEVALIIFVVVFIGIIMYTWAPSRQKALKEASMIPLNDEPTPSRPDATPRHKEH